MNPPKIYGLIGYPVQHSLSPTMHNAAFKALNINAEYRLFEVEPEKLEDFLLRDILVKDIHGNSARARDILGFNITVPHKIKAREILERKFAFDKNAYLMQVDLYYVKLSGAINTARRDDGELKYWNTDAAGFLESLETGLEFETKNKNVLLIGCGGAGRAIIAGLSWKNTGVKKIYINDIKDEAIKSAQEHFSQFPHLKDRLEFISTEDISTVITGCDLLINASPVGMKGEDISVVDKNLLHKDLYVYDVVYNQKAQTRLVSDARLLGMHVADGLSMLLYQGARAFQLWTNQKAPVEIMRRALTEAMHR